jgi:hypothetical protein
LGYPRWNQKNRVLHSIHSDLLKQASHENGRGIGANHSQLPPVHVKSIRPFCFAIVLARAKPAQLTILSACEQIDLWPDSEVATHFPK